MLGGSAAGTNWLIINISPLHVPWTRNKVLSSGRDTGFFFLTGWIFRVMKDMGNGKYKLNVLDIGHKKRKEK